MGSNPTPSKPLGLIAYKLALLDELSVNNVVVGQKKITIHTLDKGYRESYFLYYNESRNSSTKLCRYHNVDESNSNRPSVGSNIRGFAMVCDTALINIYLRLKLRTGIQGMNKQTAYKLLRDTGIIQYANPSNPTSNQIITSDRKQGIRTIVTSAIRDKLLRGNREKILDHIELSIKQGSSDYLKQLMHTTHYYLKLKSNLMRVRTPAP